MFGPGCNSPNLSLPMKNILRDCLLTILAVLITGCMFISIQPPAEAKVKAETETKQVVKNNSPEPSKLAPVAVSKPDPVNDTPPTPAPVVEPPKPQIQQPPLNNETIAWNHLIANGYTREQTAGIMGNLQQEHGFQTSDTPPEGLGIAQWTGGRRMNLMARSNYEDISIQLQFLTEELLITYHSANAAIKASGNVEGATVAFQNLYERCGKCMESQRISYAYAILGRH